VVPPSPWLVDLYLLPAAPIPVDHYAILRHSAICNVVGFRPSVGRIPNPEASFGWWTLTTSGCLGRSVADLAFVLSTIAGPDSRAPLSINEPGEPFARPLDRSFKSVRVAWFKDLGGVPFDRRVRTVVDAHGDV
jgi:amidase